MILPDRLTAPWISALGNTQLVEVESHLHGEFFAAETHEKKRRGDRYALLQGSEALVTAWHRWAMVNNEVRTRGLVIRHRSATLAPNARPVSDDGSTAP